MVNKSIKIYELVKNATEHSWSIPEFQRGFVWKTVQVRDLAESLWYKYPIGTLLLWDGNKDCEERFATDSKRPNLWVIDGQQRTTALSILFGRKPYWWPDNETWEETLKKYDIRFDIEAIEEPYFVVANAVIRKSKTKKYIKLRDIFKLSTNKENDDKELGKMAKAIKEDGLCKDMDDMEIFTKLDRIRKIRDILLGVITVDHGLEHVVEIFSRMNSKGTRVKEADIYLGIAAAKSPGWVRNEFLPYLSKLKDSGFDFTPSLLFKILTGIGVQKVRFKDIKDEFWSSGLKDTWKQTCKALENVLIAFKEHGILSNSIMPTQTALVTIVCLAHKFSVKEFYFFMYWFVQASRFGRYSGAGTTSLEEDLRIIKAHNNPRECIKKLLHKFNTKETFQAEDFLKDYSDGRFGMFLFYLMIYKNKAKDWDESGNRIGFNGEEILADNKPHWHHVFPKKYLKGHIDKDKINAIANMAVIGPRVNIRISAKSPMSYIKQYGIGQEKLKDQFIDEDIVNIDFKGFEKWLDRRATVLAQEANEYLDSLKKEKIKLDESCKDGVILINNFTLPYMHEPKKATDRKREDFVNEWNSVLQIIRGIESLVIKDENRPTWIPKNISKGVLVDQFLHAFYYTRTKSPESKKKYLYEEHYKKNWKDPETAVMNEMQWWRKTKAEDFPREHYFITKRAPRLSELLSKNKIKNISKEEFQEMCGLFYAFYIVAKQYPKKKLDEYNNEGMRIKRSLVANRVYEYSTAKGLGVGEVLYYVLYNGPREEVVYRMYEALENEDYHIKNFGLSCLGELVGWGLSDIYPPRNDRTNKALRGLGYNVTVRNPKR